MRTAPFAVALAFLGLCGTAGAARTDVSIPQIVVNYTATSLKVALGSGTPVQSGTTIPAGSYQIVVNDDPNTGDQNPNFTMSGPGVSVTSNLNSTGMGIDGSSSFGPFTLQTTSTYTIEDKTLGASTLVTFTTSAVSNGATGSQPPPVTSGGAGPSNGSTGSSATTTTGMLGTLKATVSASGKPSLTFGGRAVKTLEPGRYTVSVDDLSKKAGLELGKSSGKPLSLSGAAKVGTSSHAVTLSAGKWFLEVTGGGPKASFTVS
jgi:hypothetical protein